MYSGYNGAASNFDTMRDLSQLRSCMQQRFLIMYGAMIRGSLSKNGTVNPEEVLNDAQEMLDIELKQATILYDHPDAKPLADKNVYADLSLTVLIKRMKDLITTYNKKNPETAVSEEKINEIINKLETTVNDAREANRKLLEEKENEAKALSEENAKTDEVKENNPNRENIAVDFKDGGVIELSPIISEDDAPSKSSVKIQN